MDEKVGCLIIHGFAGGIHEIELLGQYLESRGFDVACPKLKGHTGRSRDLAGVSYREWIASAEEELIKLKALCDRIILIGFSMGGLIGANLAVKYNAEALITLCAPIYHWDFKRIVINLKEDFISGEFKHLKHYLQSAMIPVSALINFEILLTRTKPILGKITCPAFIAQALKDDTVQHRSAKFIYNNVSSGIKEIKYYGNSGHVICNSIDGPGLFRDVEGFMERYILYEEK